MKGEVLSPNGYKLAYEMIEGSAPGVFFLTGFKSDMEGQKALALREYCVKHGIAFTRFDYGGHGASGGPFEEGTISTWLMDALQVFDCFTEGPMVLVGSSMGAWIALLLALERQPRVAGIIGIAPAPDFTEKLIWEAATSEQRAQLLSNGFFPIPNCYGGEPYHITQQLIEDGRHHLLLDSPIAIDCPVWLLHGTKDADVPLDIAFKLIDCLPNARLTLVQDGNHRLSEPEHLQLLTDTLEHLIVQIKQTHATY